MCRWRYSRKYPSLNQKRRLRRLCENSLQSCQNNRDTVRGYFFMRHIQGSCRTQTNLLPASIEDYVPDDHPVRVIDAFVDSLDVGQLGFKKADTAATGRRPYHPGDLLKLYLYAYLNQTSSTAIWKSCG